MGGPHPEAEQYPQPLQNQRGGHPFRQGLRVAPGSDDIIHDGDVLVVIGENTDLERVNKLGKR